MLPPTGALSVLGKKSFIFLLNSEIFSPSVRFRLCFIKYVQTAQTSLPDYIRLTAFFFSLTHFFYCICSSGWYPLDIADNIHNPLQTISQPFWDSRGLCEDCNAQPQPVQECQFYRGILAMDVFLQIQNKQAMTTGFQNAHGTVKARPSPHFSVFKSSAFQLALETNVWRYLLDVIIAEGPCIFSRSFTTGMLCYFLKVGFIQVSPSWESCVDLVMGGKSRFIQ